MIVYSKGNCLFFFLDLLYFCLFLRFSVNIELFLYFSLYLQFVCLFFDSLCLFDQI